MVLPGLPSRTKKKRDREAKKRPTKRPLGCKDICTNCGRTYIVNSGTQKYCPDCQSIMHKEIDKQQGSKYYREHYNTEEKRTERSKKRRERYPKIKDKINAARRNQYKQKKAIDH